MSHALVKLSRPGPPIRIDTGDWDMGDIKDVLNIGDLIEFNISEMGDKIAECRVTSVNISDYNFPILTDYLAYKIIDGCTQDEKLYLEFYEILAIYKQ